MSEEIKAEEMTTESKKNGFWQKLSAGNKKLLLVAAAVVIAAAIGLGGVYNSPANQLSRQLNLGQKYLEEQNYEQAVVAFLNAIQIDDKCVEAYLGCITAYAEGGNTEELAAIYDSALETVNGLEKAALNENMETVVSIYLAAGEVYDDPGTLAKTLEQGFLISKENAEIKEELIKAYEDWAEQKNADDEKILEIYDRLLELKGEDAQILEDMSLWLGLYIKKLWNDKKFDEVKKLVEKYGDYNLSIDTENILAKTEELETAEAQNQALMEKVYAYMEAQDYEAMLSVDGSEEAADLAGSLGSGRSYVYFPENTADDHGMGTGIYTFGEGYYYFYYGNYANGERTGNGVIFIKNGEYQYTVFEGEWANDAPNGYGEERIENEKSTNDYVVHSKVKHGNLKEGLWDGKVEVILTDGSGSYDLSFEAVSGIPTEDKTEEINYELWWFDMSDLDDGEYVYAYEYNENTGSCWYAKVKRGKRLGIYGFAD